MLQEDGVIAAVGTYDELHRKHPTVPVIGTGKEILLPGFVNGHHHVGLTPVQLGSPDMPLELWFITRMVIRNVDLYLDTLYSAFEMIGSGITTVQHIQGWMPGTLPDVEKRATETIRAYEDVGMRGQLLLRRARPEPARLPGRRGVRRKPAEGAAGPDAALVRPLQDEPRRRDGHVQVVPFAASQQAPGEDPARARQPALVLGQGADGAVATPRRKYNAPMHMHLVETAYQKEYARRRGDCTALEYIDRFGLVNERLTLGHGVWLNEKDIDRLAAAKGCVCHNCSSNFRLRSGVAALNFFEKKGINTAIGLDEAGINDDRDMLQELKLVLRAHRVPGMVEDDVPTMAQVLRMATVGGAKTTPFGTSIGTLEVGKAADMVLIDWDSVAYPYLDELTPTLDAVIQRAKSQAVTMTMCDGEVIYQDGKFTKVDKTAALKALHDDLSKALADDEVERRKLSKALLPHVRKFYADYIDTSKHQPFYRPSSMV